MRTPIIVGNWKMNKTVAEAVDFVNEIKEQLDAMEGVDVGFCPTAVAIPALAEALEGTRIGVGAQNMHWAESGAYTGELAPNMLTPFCTYVILGHSERRADFGETDEGVNRKVKAALTHGLIPIVCVGESLEQNEAGETVPFVRGQIKAAFDGLTAEQMKQVVVAYEPIWAIGTGRSATAAIAGDTIQAAVRQPIAEMFGQDVADAIRVQYGGSVKPANIEEFMAHPDIDGALVGGASLKPSFVQVVSGALPVS